MEEEEILYATKKWIKSVVIDLNLCPFAAKAFMDQSIKYFVFHQDMGLGLTHVLKNELEHLDKYPEVETTLVILKDHLLCFKEYLRFVSGFRNVLDRKKHKHKYQIATFHTDYCFSGSDEKDAANYTNRSPFPMIHILREKSISKALKYFKDIKDIPVKNIERTRNMGLEAMAHLLDKCMTID